jgi:hypothetical protein
MSPIESGAKGTTPIRPVCCKHHERGPSARQARIPRAGGKSIQPSPTGCIHATGHGRESTISRTRAKSTQSSPTGCFHASGHKRHRANPSTFACVHGKHQVRSSCTGAARPEEGYLQESIPGGRLLQLLLLGRVCIRNLPSHLLLLSIVR